MLSIILSLLCIFSPFLLAVVLGHNESVRAQFTFPILIASITMFLNNFSRKKIFYTVLIVIIASQSFYTLKLLYDDNKQYDLDKQFANDIMSKIGTNSYKKVVFIGQKQLPDNLLKGEAIGSSFFHNDHADTVDTNYRATGLIRALGYDVLETEELEYEQIMNEFGNLNTTKCIYESDQYYLVLLKNC